MQSVQTPTIWGALLLLLAVNDGLAQDRPSEHDQIVAEFNRLEVKRAAVREERDKMRQEAQALLRDLSPLEQERQRGEKEIENLRSTRQAHRAELSRHDAAYAAIVARDEKHKAAFAAAKERAGDRDAAIGRENADLQAAIAARNKYNRELRTKVSIPDADLQRLARMDEHLRARMKRLDAAQEENWATAKADKARLDQEAAATHQEYARLKEQSADLGRRIDGYLAAVEANVQALRAFQAKRAPWFHKSADFQGRAEVLRLRESWLDRDYGQLSARHQDWLRRSQGTPKPQVPPAVADRTDAEAKLKQAEKTLTEVHSGLKWIDRAIWVSTISKGKALTPIDPAVDAMKEFLKRARSAASDLESGVGKVAKLAEDEKPDPAGIKKETESALDLLGRVKIAGQADKLERLYRRVRDVPVGLVPTDLDERFLVTPELLVARPGEARGRFQYRLEAMQTNLDYLSARREEVEEFARISKQAARAMVELQQQIDQYSTSVRSVPMKATLLVTGLYMKALIELQLDLIRLGQSYGDLAAACDAKAIELSMAYDRERTRRDNLKTNIETLFGFKKIP